MKPKSKIDLEQEAILKSLHSTSPELAALVAGISAEKDRTVKAAATVRLTLSIAMLDKAVPDSLKMDLTDNAIAFLVSAVQAELLSKLMQIGVDNNDIRAIAYSLPDNHVAAERLTERYRSQLENLMDLIINQKEKCNAKNRL